MNTVKCPHCKKQFPISEAISHEETERILDEEKRKHQEELEKVKKEAATESSKKIQEQFELQTKRLEEDSKEKDTRIKELTTQLSQLLEELRSAKRAKEESEVEMQKKLLVEEEKIRLDAQKKAEEEQHTKIAEKEKQLSDALKANEDMRRKLQQGSQQTQGEVFELEFEKMLHSEFPNDQITEVAEGVRGGDIVHEVWDRNGNNCGKILWELKNTKTWSEQWIDKLKGDQREATADWAVLISEVVPNGVESAKYYKNIWVTKKSFVIGLAGALRMNLIQVAMAKRAAEGKKEKMDVLYSYLSGTEFRLRIDAMVEAFTNMQVEIEKEKRYFNNKWSRDEKNIRQVIDNTYGMHGDLKGIMGAVLPQIKDLDLLEDGE